MTRDSDRFETLVHRIHELLEGDGTIVTWNDKVVDPDTDGRRQVDVTIRRGQSLTHVECRKHREPQDVQWIEELIGRRASLQADAMIAVSNSGFTAPAVSKAQKHGIITRSLVDLTPEEILSWGRSTEVMLYYFRFNTPRAVVLIDGLPTSEVDAAEVSRILDNLPMMRALFNAASTKAGEVLKIYEPFEGLVANVGLTLEHTGGDQVGGRSLVAIEFSAAVTLHRVELSLPSVRAYRSPADANDHAIVEAFDLGETSVVHRSEDVSCIIDLTPLDLPPFSLFKMAAFKTDEERNYASLEFVGVERMLKTGGPMPVSIHCRLSEGGGAES